MFKASTLMLNTSHYDFRAGPGQKYLIWQTPWEHEWEMPANLWSRLPACRCSSLLHHTALSSLGHPALLKASSHSLFKPKLLSGAQGQQTGRQQEPETQPALAVTEMFGQGWALWLLQKISCSRQERSCCCTPIVYLKRAREKCSVKFAEIWTEIQT